MMKSGDLKVECRARSHREAAHRGRRRDRKGGASALVPAFMFGDLWSIAFHGQETMKEQGHKTLTVYIVSSRMMIVFSMRKAGVNNCEVIFE